jgi:hypothetical protein
MKGYNGWTNFETWKVWLEFFDGLEDTYRNGDAAATREAVESFIEETSFGWARSLALSFLEGVDWEEIAEHLAGEDEDTEETEA